MAYALVVWRGDDAAAQAFSAIQSIEFFRGLLLVDDDGADWDSMRQTVEAVVQGHPGTEAVIVMPAKAARVGGWVHDSLPMTELERARAIMNRKGSSTVPVLWATPPIP